MWLYYSLLTIFALSSNFVLGQHLERTMQGGADEECIVSNCTYNYHYFSCPEGTSLSASKSGNCNGPFAQHICCPAPKTYSRTCRLTSCKDTKSECPKSSRHYGQVESDCPKGKVKHRCCTYAKSQEEFLNEIKIINAEKDTLEPPPPITEGNEGSGEIYDPFSIGFLQPATCEISSPLISNWAHAKLFHKSAPIEEKDYIKISSLGSSIDFPSLVRPMLIPRVAGTENNTIVRNYIKKHMTGLGWTIEVDAFTDQTPLGPVAFENVIATLDPKAKRRLVLACHYDSKPDEGYFVAASDSAVPCAMMMHLASALKEELGKGLSPELTLQFVFFDGEEAFVAWEGNDNTYGARHLAKKWEDTPYGDGGTNELSRIDFMMLLDLLGTGDMRVNKIYQETAQWYTDMVKIQVKLTKMKLAQKGQILNDQRIPAYIADDHVPFVTRCVNIMHLISGVFPRVWHTPDDDESALDYKLIDKFNKILRIFVLKYLQGKVET